MKRLMRVKDVAEHLGVSTDAVWEMTRDGRLKSVVLGKRLIRFKPEDVESLVDEWTTQRRIR